MTSAKTLFPNKVTFIDTGSRGFNKSLWGALFNPQQGLTGNKYEKGAWGHARLREQSTATQLAGRPLFTGAGDPDIPVQREKQNSLPTLARHPWEESRPGEGAASQSITFSWYSNHHLVVLRFSGDSFEASGALSRPEKW